MKSIKVGSRESRLAIIQARLVIASIERHHPELRTELVTMKTSGDRILDRPLDAVGGKGLFVKELDEALLAGRVDICVHSYKDLPAGSNPRLPVVAVSAREDPRDVLVLPEGREHPAADCRFGTSSPRRQSQLAALFPNGSCLSVRGNLQTRLRKLEAGECDALVLAAAGLKRSGLWERAGRVFTIAEMLPAACQGILAVQGRLGEEHDYLKQFHNLDAEDAARAERAFVEALGASCNSPVAAFAQIDGDTLLFSAMRVDADAGICKGESRGERSRADEIGRELAVILQAP